MKKARKVAKRLLVARPFRIRRSRGWNRSSLTVPNLRRLSPISSNFGFDRGLPIDRYYIERFLSDHRNDVHGHALEIQNDTYIRKFGGERVIKTDVLNLSKSSHKVTLVADLTRADNVPSNTFDCIIFTQTLQHIYAKRAALKQLYRMLRPFGVLLATVPGIARTATHEEEDSYGEYWHFTAQSAWRLFSEVFPEENVRVTAYGNVLTAICFLHGLAAQELSTEELNHFDSRYEVLVALRAIKPG